MAFLPVLSSILGWSYFTIWTISFYPQVYKNYQLKSVAGFSFDVLLLNTLAYVCYSFFTCALYFNDTIRSQYIKHEHTVGNQVPVQPSDVAFAVHGLAICLFMYTQFVLYKWGIQKLSKFYLTAFIVGLLTMAALILSSYFQWLPWLTTVTIAGYMKMAAAYIRCIPQVYLNYKRKSTYGYSMLVVVMDFMGGTGSILQQLVDCYIYNDDKELTGNIPKFLLAVQSLLVDTVYIFQAYIFYPGCMPKECLIDSGGVSNPEIQGKDLEPGVARQNESESDTD